MEALVRIDEKLIDVVEKALLAARTRLGVSFPRAVSLCASITIILMALSVFMSSGDLLTVKIPLLVLYAVLAFAMGRTLFRDLSHFNNIWNSEIDKILSKSAMWNREKLRPVRALCGFFAVTSFFFTGLVSLNLLSLGATSLVDTGKDLLGSLLGIPVLLIYQYTMCARPSGRPTL
jgi:hypothetical protein